MHVKRARKKYRNKIVAAIWVFILQINVLKCDLYFGPRGCFDDVLTE